MHLTRAACRPKRGKWLVWGKCRRYGERNPLNAESHAASGPVEGAAGRPAAQHRRAHLTAADENERARFHLTRG
jgi:hypothetical protein